MAQYTVELRTLMSDPNVSPLLNKALSTYPIYKPFSDNEEVRAIIPTRESLNQKLLNHYKYREIGFETVGRFLEELEIAMNEIMPLYNQRFNTVEIMALIDDPFGNVDVTETFRETRTGNEKTNASGSGTDKSNTTTSANDETTIESQSNSDSKNVKSGTPQNALSITAEQIDSVPYADEVNWAKNHGEDNSTSTGRSSTTATNESENSSENESNTDRSETVEHTFTKKGNQGVNTYAHDMIEFRESIIDVTMEIIEDIKIKELFMQVF